MAIKLLVRLINNSLEQSLESQKKNSPKNRSLTRTFHGQYFLYSGQNRHFGCERQSGALLICRLERRVFQYNHLFLPILFLTCFHPYGSIACRIHFLFLLKLSFLNNGSGSPFLGNSSNGSSCILYCTRNTPLCPSTSDGRRKVRFPITSILHFGGICTRKLYVCHLLRQLSHVLAACPQIRKGQKFSHQHNLWIFFIVCMKLVDIDEQQSLLNF